MFAFLFDRRSGLKTGLLVAALALVLFGGGVLVGLNLRWSKEELAAGIFHPRSLESLVVTTGEPASSGKATAPPGAREEGASPGPAAPPANGGKAASGAAPAAPDEDWVPVTRDAPPPGPST